MIKGRIEILYCLLILAHLGQHIKKSRLKSCNPTKGLTLTLILRYFNFILNKVNILYLHFCVQNLEHPTWKQQFWKLLQNLH